MPRYRLFPAFALVIVTLAACGSDTTPPTMPDLAGKQLDAALTDLETSGITDDVDIDSPGLFGVLDETNWEVCGQTPEAGAVVTDPPKLTVDRSCEGSEASASDVPATNPAGQSAKDSSEAVSDEADVPESEPYTYVGPEYEVVVVDEDAGLGELDQVWVYTQKLETSTDSYRDQVKLLIADVARAEGTDRLIVQVVTDKEIIEAESHATIESYLSEHDAAYIRDVLVPIEATDWIAWYSGGIDPTAVELSDADSAFEVTWMIASDNPVIEQWRPEIAD